MSYRFIPMLFFFLSNLMAETSAPPPKEETGKNNKQKEALDREKVWKDLLKLKRDDESSKVKELFGDPSQITSYAELYQVHYETALSIKCWVYLFDIKYGAPYEEDISILDEKAKPKALPESGFAVIVSFQKDGKLRDIVLRKAKETLKKSEVEKTQYKTDHE